MGIGQAVPDQIKSLSLLRGAHTALLRRRAGGAIDEMVAEAELLRQQAKAMGRWLHDPVERDAAQAIIDYWTSYIGSLPGQPFPKLETLDEYASQPIEEIAEAAAAFYAKLGPQEQLAARRLFEALFDGRGDRPQTRRVGRDALWVHAQPAEPSSVDRLIERFAATGALLVEPGKNPEEDRIEVLSTELPQHWSGLGGWISARETLHRAAQLWKEAESPSGYLLSGAALKAAAPYRADRGSIGKFLEASERAAANRTRLVALASVAALVGTAFSAGLLMREQEAGEDRVDTIKNQVLPDVEPTERADLPAETALSPKADVAGPGLTGCLWAGGDGAFWTLGDASRLAPVNGPDVKKGQNYRARAPLAVRQDCPDAAPYSEKPRIGTAGRGALVRVTADPRPYSRPSGTQFWAPVRVIPQVYLQWSGSAASAEENGQEALRKALADAGFDMPEAENTPRWKGGVEVRFFNDADKPVAEELARSIAVRYDAGSGEPLKVACQRLDMKQTPNVLEVWADLTTLKPRNVAGRAVAPAPTKFCG